MDPTIIFLNYWMVRMLFYVIDYDVLLLFEIIESHNISFFNKKNTYALANQPTINHYHDSLLYSFLARSQRTKLIFSISIWNSTIVLWIHYGTKWTHRMSRLRTKNYKPHKVLSHMEIRYKILFVRIDRKNRRSLKMFHKFNSVFTML